MSQRTDYTIAAMAACLALICATPASAQRYYNAAYPPFPFSLFQDSVPDEEQDCARPPRAVPETRIIVPQERVVVPQERYVVPQERYIVPQERYVVPQERYVVPQERYVVPQERYVVPQGRIIA